MFCAFAYSFPLKLHRYVVRPNAAILLATLVWFGSCENTAAQTPLLQVDSGGHQATIKGLAFTPDGTQIVSAGDDKTIRIWDWRKAKTVRTIRGEIEPGNAGKVFALALSPDARWLAIAGWMDASGSYEPCCGDIRLFDFASGRLLALLKGHENLVYDLAFSPDSQLLLSGSADQAAIIWNVAEAREIGRLIGHRDRISKVALSRDGQYALTASYDSELRLWHVSDGRLLRTMQGHKSRIFALALSPTENLAASADADARRSISES